MQKKEIATINHLFEHITRDRDHLDPNAPDELKAYFEESAQLPDWADQDLMALGQQIYLRHGFWVSLLLCYKSLPECYACADGSEVLHRTARLNEKHGSTEAFSRRISETAQFVFFAMLPGGLSKKGRGLVATQKVRLIHAVIRHYIKANGWDAEKYGEPINQEDLAGTLMSFSALILEGMDQIGIELEPVELEAYMHCWRVIGHIVGLDDDLIPSNAKDALKLGHSILDQQIKESESGKALTRALLEWINLKSHPFFAPNTNVAIMKIMMGKEISDLLAVPESNAAHQEKIEKRIKKIAQIGEFLDKSLIFAMVLQFFTRIFSQFMISKMTKSNILNFYLPKSLTEDWGTKKTSR
ncbi:MAG: oxygenase MpaB family protein [Mongoliitalea sp.]